VSSLSAVPVRTDSIPDGEITVTRSSLALLLAIDGRRTVADHARERGFLQTLRRLSELIRHPDAAQILSRLPSELDTRMAFICSLIGAHMPLVSPVR
jgi:hypothetical protein